MLQNTKLFSSGVINASRQIINTPKNILITGKPGVGKTTLVRKICAWLEGSVGGFYTGEIREGGRRVGFKVTSLDGEESVLSHVSIRNPFSVGKYKIDVEAFEKIGVAAVERALVEKSLIVIDEIGKMELFSSRFREMVARALNSEKTVLATAPAYPVPFVDKIKLRDDIRLFSLNVRNRDSLPSEVLKMLS